jgi:hypothetical protein
MAGVLVVVLNGWTQYTSDSVAQQSLVRTWLDVGHGTAYLPSDTWILKLPLYVAVESLPLSPDLRLVLEVVALNVGCMLLLTLAALWLARMAAVARPRTIDVVAPLVWLAALGGELGANRMQPNYRNIELGLSFVALAIAARYVDARDPRRGPELQTGLRAGGFGPALAVLLLGFLWLDDPYFAFTVAVPFAALCGAWFLLRRRGYRRLLIVAGTVVLSLLVTAGLTTLLNAIGLHVSPPAGQTELPKGGLAHRLSLLTHATAAQLGLADSDPSAMVPGTGTPISPLAASLTAVVTVVAVLAGLALTWHGWHRRLLLPAFLGVHWVLIGAAFLISSRVSEVGHGRYLILACYDLAVSLAVVLPAVRRRWPRAAHGVVLLLLTSAVLNMTCTLWTAPRIEQHRWDRLPAGEAAPNRPAQEQAIRDAVAATHLSRGYAQFWSANLNLYRSGGRISVNSVTCVRGQLMTDNWLTDTARRTASSNGTFLVYEPGSSHFHGCDLAELRNQLGPPASALPAGSGAIVLIYDTDIGPRIPAWNPSIP